MSSKALNIVIVGGSTAGLMHGIMAKRLGHNVHILEQYDSHHRESEAAGITALPEMHKFMEQFDRIPDSPWCVPTFGLHMMDPAFKLSYIRPVPFRMTSWKVLYYRLRANFDGLVSEIAPTPPNKSENDGSVLYDVGKRVVSVSCTNESNLEVVYEDLITGTTGTLKPDFLIAADGANSTILKLLVPEVKHSYAGFLTWRGTVLEKDLSEETRQVFGEHALMHWPKPGGSYIIEYVIPGDDGSLEPGKRCINLAWHYNCPGESSEFTAALTDSDGISHRRTVPFGKVDPIVWAKQLRLAKEIFGAPICEALDKIKRPFVTANRDSITPRASFFNGKVVLVGDALALVRPNIAASTSQAAKHCMGLQEVLKGSVTLDDWEREALFIGKHNLLRARSVSSYFLSPGYVMYYYYDWRAKIAAWLYKWGF